MSDQFQQADGGAQQAPAAAAPQKQSVLTERSLQPAGRDANGRVARMHISTRRDCISLSAPFDGEWVSVLFTIAEFDTLLINLNQMVTAKEPMSMEVDAYVGGADNRRLDGTVRLGRDEDGIIYITLCNNGREQRFDFRPSDNYVWKANGQPIPVSDASRRNAQAWITRMSDYCGKELRDNFVGFQGRQGEGGQQGQRQGGNGYQGGGNNYNRNNNNYNRGGQGGGWKSGNGGGGKWNGNRGGGNNYNRGNGYQGAGQGGGNYNRGGNYQGGNGGGNRNYQGGGNYQQNQQQSAPAEPSVDFDAYVNNAI